VFIDKMSYISYFYTPAGFVLVSLSGIRRCRSSQLYPSPTPTLVSVACSDRGERTDRSGATATSTASAAACWCGRIEMEANKVNVEEQEIGGVFVATQL
jgi:hypothetical protein